MKLLEARILDNQKIIFRIEFIIGKLEIIHFLFAPFYKL